ncbi:MAG: prepilin-type N-terminal cleavage/methylation domain-containing protein [Candidatus Nomurabacteria bacterium]|nr:MAG: prepilin-type N-terminal cleavage/methylation domain-containing protein [Candidatus Nomurabacteria bacterium]
MNKRHFFPATPNTEGFTVIEMIITIIVLAIFLLGVFQSYLLLESQRVDVARRARASDIAFSNLAKFPSPPSNLLCNPGKMDLTANNASSKRGENIIDTSDPAVFGHYGYAAESGSTIANMGSSLVQTVTAFAPNGCTGTSFTDGIVKLVSTVNFGNGEFITHANFIR